MNEDGRPHVRKRETCWGCSAASYPYTKDTPWIRLQPTGTQVLSGYYQANTFFPFTLKSSCSSPQTSMSLDCKNNTKNNCQSQDAL